VERTGLKPATSGLQAAQAATVDPRQPVDRRRNPKTVFLGDQIYDHKHCFLADGFYAEWLANIEKLRARFPDDAVFYIGHGGPVDGEMWDWQRGYIELFVDAVSSADWSEPEQAKATVVSRMKEYEPSDELQFLMELSIEPIAAKLGLLSPSP
jgi:glyoxylase-like metal-dependent hydrolase (beta-lactamase superfamily II)